MLFSNDEMVDASISWVKGMMVFIWKAEEVVWSNGTGKREEIQPVNMCQFGKDWDGVMWISVLLLWRDVDKFEFIQTSFIIVIDVLAKPASLVVAFRWKGGTYMYEEFGAFVSGNSVEFRVFFPDSAVDPSQYSQGKLPNITSIQVTGTFQNILGQENWDYRAAPELVKSDTHQCIRLPVNRIP